MESVINYQTEIRIADLLALMEADKCKHYLCHNVAYLLRDRIAEIPGYRQYETAQRSYIAGSNYEDIDYQHETNAIPYYFINDEYDIINHHDLTPQIVSQLNEWVRKFKPGIELDDYMFDEFKISLVLFGAYRFNDRGIRIELLQKIVEAEPDAVLSIRL